MHPSLRFFVAGFAVILLLMGCTPTVTQYRRDSNGQYVRVETRTQRGSSAYDDTFYQLVDQRIAREEATGHPETRSLSAKEFWHQWYHGIRLQPGPPWHPSDFKTSEEMIAYIKQKRREHGLPTYD